MHENKGKNSPFFFLSDYSSKSLHNVGAIDPAYRFVFSWSPVMLYCPIWWWDYMYNTVNMIILAKVDFHQ